MQSPNMERVQPGAGLPLQLRPLRRGAPLHRLPPQPHSHPGNGPDIISLEALEAVEALEDNLQRLRRRYPVREENGIFGFSHDLPLAPLAPSSLERTLAPGIGEFRWHATPPYNHAAAVLLGEITQSQHPSL